MRKWLEKRLHWVPILLWSTVIVFAVVFSVLAWHYKSSTKKALNDGVRDCRCICEAP